MTSTKEVKLSKDCVPRFDDLKLGDFIKIKIRVPLLWNGHRVEIEHYGIYAGENKIVHNKPGFGWMSSNGGGVELCSFKDFLKMSSEMGQPWEKVPDSCLNLITSGEGPHKGQFSGDETVARAVGRVGEKQFHLKKSNSEHFVVECRYGIHSSGQFTKAVLKHVLGVTLQTVLMYSIL